MSEYIDIDPKAANLKGANRSSYSRTAQWRVDRMSRPKAQPRKPFPNKIRVGLQKFTPEELEARLVQVRAELNRGLSDYFPKGYRPTRADMQQFYERKDDLQTDRDIIMYHLAEWQREKDAYDAQTRIFEQAAQGGYVQQ